MSNTCDARDDGWRCTLPRNHSGRHKDRSWLDGFVYHSWGDAPPRSGGLSLSGDEEIALVDLVAVLEMNAERIGLLGAAARSYLGMVPASLREKLAAGAN